MNTNITVYTTDGEQIEIKLYEELTNSDLDFMRQMFDEEKDLDMDDVLGNLDDHNIQWVLEDAESQEKLDRIGDTKVNDFYIS